MNVRGASGGILIGADSTKYEIICREEGRFILSVILKGRTENWRQLVTAVYGPNHSEFPKDCREEIGNLRLCHKLSWVIGGDFNIVRFSEERLGDNTNIGERALFNELINRAELKEIPLHDRQYT